MHQLKQISASGWRSPPAVESGHARRCRCAYLVIPRRLLARLRAISPLHIGVGQGMLWIIAFVVFSRGVGAAREIAIAYRYGVSELIDVYLLVFTMVAFLPGVLASVFQSVLVPQTLKLSIPDRRRLDAELTGLVVLSGSVLALLLAAGLPALIGLVSPGWSSEALRSASIIAYTFAPLVVAGLLIGLFTAQLVRSDVRSPPLFEAIPGATVLIAVLAAGQPTLWPLIIGTVSGLAIQCVGLGWLAWRNGAIVAPRFRFSSPSWSPFLNSAGVIIVGQLLASAVPPIDQLITPPSLPS